MIHTASLLHDDVIDMADTRRGMKSVNFVFGNKLAILAGDFLLARASVSLARLRNLDVRAQQPCFPPAFVCWGSWLLLCIPCIPCFDQVRDLCNAGQ